MHKRINVSLPEETIQLIDRAADRGNRSQLIDKAVRYFLTTTQQKWLRQQVKEGAVRRAKRDLLMAEDWSPLEEEIWTENDR